MTDFCLDCQKDLNHDLTFSQVLSLAPLEFPVLCPDCRSSYRRFISQSPACEGCQRSLDPKVEDLYRQVYHWDDSDYCYDCYRWRKNHSKELLKHYPIYHYNQALREWIYRYKYQGDVRLAWIFKEELKTIYPTYSDFQWLVLPSSPRSLKERYFHPVSLLLDTAGIPHQCCFNYVGDNQRQAQKNRQERLQLKQPFEIASDFEFVDKKYLIFDDIYTTGATILAAKSLLRQCLDLKGGGEIISLSLARDDLDEK
ncbi:ComF family protein [Hutsoniella sourekii]